MSKFVAVRDNFGYLGTYWRKGDVLEAESLPNEHFVPLGQYSVKVANEDAAKKEQATKAAETVEKAVKARRGKKD